MYGIQYEHYGKSARLRLHLFERRAARSMAATGTLVRELQGFLHDIAEAVTSARRFDDVELSVDEIGRLVSAVESGDVPDGVIGTPRRRVPWPTRYALDFRTDRIAWRGGGCAYRCGWLWLGRRLGAWRAALFGGSSMPRTPHPYSCPSP